MTMTERKTVGAEVHARALEQIADLERQLAACTAQEDEVGRERDEAHQREAATAEVLRVISRSPESLDVALQAVADTAGRLCRADFTRVFLREGEYLVLGPSARPAGAEDDTRAGERWGPIADLPSPAFRAAITGRTVHVEDVLRYIEEHGASGHDLEWAENLRQYGYRTILAVPLLRGSEVVGVLAPSRLGEVRPFSDREIAMAESFADQAAIAVENARLFQGIQERNRELTESLA